VTDTLHTDWPLLMSLGRGCAIVEALRGISMFLHALVWVAVPLSIMTGLPSIGRAEPTRPQKVAAVEGITEYRLANGLRILVFPDASWAKLTVNLTVFAGSRHEGYGEAGMAHLVEHLLCKGTTTHSDFPRILKERGARWNASTWFDCTNYYETLPASDENVAFAVRLEADRLVNGLMRSQDLDVEMPVVRNEFESGEDVPEFILEQRMRAVAYSWHNYGKPEIGNRSDIERVPIDRLRAFYRKRYRTDNAMLIIAGRFDVEKALNVVEEAFGSLTRPVESLDRTYTEEPPQDGERSVTLRRFGGLGTVGVHYHIPAGSHPDYAAVQVLSRLLTAAPSGRLYSLLVQTGKASSIKGRASALHDPGSFLIMSRVAPGKSPHELLEAMLKGLEQAWLTPFHPDELERARQQVLRDRDLIASDPDPNRFVIELSNWSALGDWRLFFIHRDRVEQVTAEQVQSVAKRYLQPSNRTVGQLVPTEKPERTLVPGAPDVATMVDGYKGRGTSAAGEFFDSAPTLIEARVSRPEPIDGVKVAFLPKKTRNEAVHLRLNLRYGNAENLKGLAAASRLLPELLTRGTKNRSRIEVRDIIDLHRTRLTVNGSPGLMCLTMETRRPALPVMLELLRQILRESALSAKEFEVLKDENVAKLEEYRNDPARLASNALSRLLSEYPYDDVRYVPTLEERIERVKATRLEELQSLYTEYLGSGQGELVVVGDFEPSQVLPHLSRAIGGWKAVRPYARIEHSYQPHLKPASRTIVTPDKVNAVYFAGLTLPMREDSPDYASLVVANFILGGAEYDNRGFKDEYDNAPMNPSFAADGALSSRLVDRLRHRGGLSYGVASFFTVGTLDNFSRLVLYANTSPSKLGEVESAAEFEFRHWVEKGVTNEELDRAKVGYLLQEEVNRSNDAQLAALLASHLHSGRTMKSVAEMENRVRRLTAEHVSRAIREHIDPSRLFSVKAGDIGGQKPHAEK